MKNYQQENIIYNEDKTLSQSGYRMEQVTYILLEIITKILETKKSLIRLLED